MAVLVGIDEAGFGPILGPLVISSSALSVPHNLMKADLWQVLRKSVGNSRRHLAGRVLIADSKKAYSRSVGIKPLARTVSAVLGCLGQSPATLSELLRLLCPDCLERLESYPWYKGAGSYAISGDQADMAIASGVLKRDLASNNLELLAVRSCCLDVAYYNDMVAAVRNKARVLFSGTSRLIKQAFDEFGRDELQIVVDRQGGRIRYRPALQRMFGEMELKILRESTAVSSYELESNGKRMRLHFAVDGDERFLPVSLASMVSKYLRELLVDNINRYFAGFHASLRPTAGYWKDGLRFIEDLRRNVPHLRYDSNQLIRCR